MAPVSEDCFEEIIAELERRPLAVNAYRKKAGLGRSTTFGLVNRRCLEPDISRDSWLRPRLYKLLKDFADRHAPFAWTSITLNQNYAAEPHRDRGNVGESYLVAFGDYQGGELKIHEGDASGSHVIRHQPVLFDGSKLLHSVAPFEGNRYSIVLYRIAGSPAVGIQQYEPVEEDGKWVLRFTDVNGATTTLKRGAGLPHPLKGRRREA